LERAVYYPNLETTHDSWLKFALLYIDVLKPIIPNSGQESLSGSFRKIMDETDLIQPYSSTAQDVARPVMRALEKLEKLRAYPEFYAEELGDTSFLQRWRSRRSWRYTLLEEKYNRSWRDYVIKEGFGEVVRGGVAVNEQLGHVFMSTFAHSVAHKLGISPVTDLPEMDRINAMLDYDSFTDSGGLNYVQQQFQVLLPKGINKIPFEDIIEFRNRRGFKKRLHAFQNALREYLYEERQGRGRGDFLSTRGSLLADMTDTLTSSFGYLVTISIGAWCLLTNPTESIAPTIGLLTAGGAGAAKTIISTRKERSTARDRHLVRSYLTKVRKISSKSAARDACEFYKIETRGGKPTIIPYKP